MMKPAQVYSLEDVFGNSRVGNKATQDHSRLDESFEKSMAGHTEQQDEAINSNRARLSHDSG